MTPTYTPAQINAALAARKAKKKASLSHAVESDAVNAERNAPIRQRFHGYIETEGFQPQTAPAHGRCYSSSTVQMLWECYLAATLAERSAT